MKLRVLPGYSALFMDYVEGAAAVRPFLPFRPDRETLAACAANASDRRIPRGETRRLLEEQASQLHMGERALENIRLLDESGTVAVVTNLPPNILGGPLRLLLRSLTAVKLAAELRRTGVRSVPLAWLQSHDPCPDSACVLNLLDSDSGLAELTLDEAASHPLEALLQGILQVVPTGVDREVVESLRAACLAHASPAAASTSFMVQIMDEWGLIFLDPRMPGFQALALEALAPARRDQAKVTQLLGERFRRLVNAGYAPRSPEHYRKIEQDSIETCLIQNSILPVAAVVVGGLDLQAFSQALPVIQELRQPQPLLWPRVSATLVEGRNRRFLEKFGLKVEDLFVGKQEVMRRTGLEAAEREGMSLFEGLFAGIASDFQKVADLAPGNDLQAEVNSSRKKITYQLEKLRERFRSASTLRRDAAIRQIERACNTLAPYSRTQECGLAALNFLLRHSQAILRQIYDKMDVWNHDHQVIGVE